MEPENHNKTFTQRVRNWWSGLRQTNLRAQTHYTVFRTTQNLKNRNGLLKQYQRRFMGGWEKWLGIGAGLAGVLMLLNPDSLWRWQLFLVVLGVLGAPLLADLWAELKKVFTEYPGKQFIGQVITLEQALVEGSGNIRLDNQEWQLSGTDCAAGTRVRVIAIKDRTLFITPVSQPQ
ncbi:MAG: NfeD family protein [Thiothrix sp.]